MTKRKTINTSEQLIGDILNKYDEQCVIFEEFTSVTHRLILDLLKSNNLRVHSVTSRIKTKESISGKLKKASEDTYQCLDDIHDICGIRIITYYPDEVDAVAGIIQKEFNIDYNLSVDKRAILDPDRFGYLSLHYIAKLSAKRLRLTEYNRFKKCKTEIQIRSILQHTWAEIEHDLGYKSKLAVPRHIRRRFSQLAGLLELADDTFAQIRDDLTEYEENVSKQIFENPDVVQIDKASVSAFCTTSPLVEQLDNEIASYSNGKISKGLTEDFIITQVSRLNYININTIGELISRYTVHKEDIFRLATKYLAKAHVQLLIKRHRLTLIKGISLLYLIYQFLYEKYHDTESLSYELTQIGIGKKDSYKTAVQLLSD